MEKSLIELIRTGLASVADLSAVSVADIIAVKSDTSAPQSRFYAEKVFGVVKDQRQVLGVPHSTEAVDRMGDIIRLKGWQLDAYKKNPVLLFGHDSGSLPIARALKVRKGQSASGMKALLIDEQYHEAEVNPQSELVWRMVESGALPGRSVGFLPIDVHVPETDEEREKLGLGKWGLEFRAQELLESSIVPVPANAEALQGKCYELARATAKQAVEDGVATWTDVQRLAGILPITELDANRIEREQRRSHVSLAGLDMPGEILVPMPSGNTIPVTAGNEVKAIINVTGEFQKELDRLVILEKENEQLRDQVADLTRAIGVFARTTEARSEDVGQEPEHSSNDDADESLYDILFEKIEERRRVKQFSEELANRLSTRLGTGESPEE